MGLSTSDRCHICARAVDEDDPFRCLVGGTIYHRACITTTMGMRVDEINSTTALDLVIRLTHKVKLMVERQTSVTEGFLRPSEFAKALGVPISSVQRWIREGRLPALRIGRLTLIPVDALRRML